MKGSKGMAPNRSVPAGQTNKNTQDTQKGNPAAELGLRGLDLHTATCLAPFL